MILYSDANASVEVARQTAENLEVNGTDVNFTAEPIARSVKVILDDVSGTFYGLAIASLGEIEVIARGEDIRQPAIADPHP